MGLQFGNDKCVKRHIEKKHQKQICPDLYVDCWKEKLVIKTNQTKNSGCFYGGRRNEKYYRKEIFRG